MYPLPFGNVRPARFCGPAIVLCLTIAAAAFGWPHAANAASMANGDHQQAVAALTDVQAAIGQLVRADASYSTNGVSYHQAAQRAINALVGAGGDGYVAAAGNPGDAAGALGHIDALLNRKATPVWVKPLHAAEANIRGAVTHLQDATKADELMDYALAASRALTYLEVAVGRPNEVGVFGGLEGALANTELAIPPGAATQDACQPPKASPSFGVHGGYVAWIAVGVAGTQHLPQAMGITSLTLHDGMIVLNTAAAKIVQKACGKQATTAPAPQQPAASTTHAAAQPVGKPAPGGPPPALYTKAQAEQGKQVFMTKCVACHGTNLQGTAGPSVAGTDFLTTAQKDGWTLEVIRYIVFNLMPRNAPASLSPQDAANIMAFLLESNCYPAGNTPFPTHKQPSFANIKLGQLPGHHPGENSKGVCEMD